MSETLEKLISQLDRQQPYKTLTEDEIRDQAARRYQSVYDQKRLSAKQAWETEDAALARELSSLQTGYDAQRASAAARARDTYSQADRHALSRGMQRSSYNESTLKDIQLAGDQALRDIDRAQSDQETLIGEKRTGLSRQLAQTLRQLDSDQKSDERAYADELSAREYDRTVSSLNTYNQLAMKLYEYQHELEQEEAEQARWKAEFNAKYGGGGGGGGGGSRKRGSSENAKENTPAKSSGVRRNQIEMMM